MQSLRKLQHDFLDYLLDKQSNIAEKISEQGAVDVPTRLHIYGNAYKLRLKSSIETDHEILGLYLGDDLFDLMAKGYIAAQPSHFASLRDFCEALPTYLKNTKPFSDNPIISELARFERNLLYAFDAADAKPCELEKLQHIPQENWPALQVRFHPSMQIFQAEWNSVQSWQALKAEETPPAESNEESRLWLIWRNEERITEFRSLATDEYAMIESFLHGNTFADVCETLLDYCSEDKVGETAMQHLMKWLHDRLIIDIKYTQ